MTALGCAADEPPVIPDELILGAPGTQFPDQWSPVIRLQTAQGYGLAPIHATLLPTGRILLSGFYRPGPKFGWDAEIEIPQTPTGPTTITVPVHAPPYRAPDVSQDGWRVQDSLFCSGHTLLADGSVLFAGGSRLAEYQASPTALVRYETLLGLDYSMRYDPFAPPASRWSIAGDHVGLSALDTRRRWYPTVTRLHDGRALVTSGWDYNFFRIYTRASPLLPFTLVSTSWGPSNLSVEAFDGAAFDVVSTHQGTPDRIFNGNYTHAFQLPVPAPDGDVLMLGDYGVPVVLDSETEAFTVRTVARPGAITDQKAMHMGSTLQLPIRAVDGDLGYANGSVLVAGGGMVLPYTQAADVYDVAANAWTRIDTGTIRHHPSTLMLPDGHVAILAGHGESSSSAAVGRVTYVDTQADFTVRSGTTVMERVRAYHTIVLLLPDARVLVGGGRTGGSVPPENEAPELQILTPWWGHPSVTPYRPVITSAPATIHHGEAFTVGWGAPLGTLREVVLVGLGSMTHSVDQNQRTIQLATAGTAPGAVTVTGPTDARHAPPGYYMLFAIGDIDGLRLPSVARIVRVE